MYEKQIFSKGMIEDVCAKPTESKQAREFLFILFRRGPHAFNALIEGLRELMRTDIIDHLNGVENNDYDLSTPPPTYEEAMKMPGIIREKKV